MEFTLQKTNHFQAVLKIKGDLDLYTQHELRNVYKQRLTELKEDLVIDMKLVEYIDSSGLGAIIHIFQNRKENGKQLYFINLTSSVLKVIQLTRLDKVLPIYQSIAEVPKTSTSKI
jgi:anti-sigma B factor antagonist